MADPGFLQEIIHTTTALEGSAGMLPQRILKSKASNDAFYTLLSFLVFETLNRVGAPAPTSGSATGRSLII